HRAPDAAVRMWNHAVEQADANRLIDGLVNLAVAVDVEPRLAPALSRTRVAGRFELPGVHPANRSAERPIAVNRLVGIRRKLHMMHVETDVDLFELLRLRVVVLNLPETRRHRRQCR